MLGTSISRCQERFRGTRCSIRKMKIARLRKSTTSKSQASLRTRTRILRNMTLSWIKREEDWMIGICLRSKWNSQCSWSKTTTRCSLTFPLRRVESRIFKESEKWPLTSSETSLKKKDSQTMKTQSANWKYKEREYQRMRWKLVNWMRRENN